MPQLYPNLSLINSESALIQVNKFEINEQKTTICTIPNKCKWRKNTMALFSWFITRKKLNSAKNNQATLEQELLTFNNNTMWPVAKVRANVVLQQQEYISSTLQLKNEIKPNAQKEFKSDLLKQHVG